VSEAPERLAKLFAMAEYLRCPCGPYQCGRIIQRRVLAARELPPTGISGACPTLM